jgi:hypothetical protein
MITTSPGLRVGTKMFPDLATVYLEPANRPLSLAGFLHASLLACVIADC